MNLKKITAANTLCCIVECAKLIDLIVLYGQLSIATLLTPLTCNLEWLLTPWSRLHTKCTKHLLRVIDLLWFLC